MPLLTDEWPLPPSSKGASERSKDPHLDELHGRIVRLRKARDTLRAQLPHIGPDISANEVASILDAELTRLLNRLSEWT